MICHHKDTNRLTEKDKEGCLVLRQQPRVINDTRRYQGVLLHLHVTAYILTVDIHSYIVTCTCLGCYVGIRYIYVIYKYIDCYTHIYICLVNGD